MQYSHKYFQHLLVQRTFESYSRYQVNGLETSLRLRFLPLSESLQELWKKRKYKLEWEKVRLSCMEVPV